MNKSPVKFSVNKFIIAAGLIACFGLNASAQTNMSCGKLLKKTVDPQNFQTVIENINRKNCFGLDSIDSKIFSDRTILGTLMADAAKKQRNKLTYGDLLTAINKVKSDTAHMSLRKLITAQNILETTKGNKETWESCKSYLITIGMPQSEMENFHQFVLQKEEKHYTYRQLVVYYQMKQQSEKKPD